MWTGEKDEILIDFVRNHEALYNIKSKDYRKAQLKQNLWNDIGTILKQSGSDCCKRWAYIRDYYIRRKGKPGTGSSGEAAKKRSDLLSFLDTNPSSQRSTITNIVGDELPDENENMEDLAAGIAENVTPMDEPETIIRSTCNEGSDDDDDNIRRDGGNDNIMKEKKKKKITHSEERLQLLKEIAQRKATPAEKELDEIDLFFNSMAKSVKKLPRYEQVQLRMQISSLVGNAELRSISKDHGQSYDPVHTRPSTSLSEVSGRIGNGSEASHVTSNDSGQIFDPELTRPITSLSDVPGKELEPTNTRGFCINEDGAIIFNM